MQLNETGLKWTSAAGKSVAYEVDDISSFVWIAGSKKSKSMLQVDRADEKSTKFAGFAAEVLITHNIYTYIYSDNIYIYIYIF